MLIRNARLVPVTEPAPQDPRRRPRGGRRRHPGRARPRPRTAARPRGGRRRRRLADAGTLGPARAPRPVDARPAPASTWRRPGRPSRRWPWSASGSRSGPTSRSIGWGHRPTAWDEAPVAAHLDAIDTEQPIVLIAGDGHHGWLNTIAPAGAGPADPPERGERGRVVHGLRPARHRAGQRRHRPGGLPPHHGGRRRARRGGARRLRVQRRGGRLGRAVGRGRGPAPGPARLLRRRPRGRHRPRAARPATRSTATAG